MFFQIFSDIQQLSDIREADIQVITDIDPDRGVKRVLDADPACFKVIDGNGFPAWVHDPVFTHPCIFVVV